MAAEPRTPDNIHPGLIAQADQLAADQAEHAEANAALVAQALAAGPDDVFTDALGDALGG